MSEICDGPIIQIVEKRLWYAPWKKKVIGVRVYGVTISLKQPEPDTFENATKHALIYKCNGKEGFLGDWRMWSRLRADRDWLTVSEVLQSYGGDPLPEELMTAEGFFFRFKSDRPEHLEKEDCVGDGRRYLYRITFY